MKITTHQQYNQFGREVIVAAHIGEDDMLNGALAAAVLREIVQQIATRFVEENYQTIAAALDPQAIANLTIAGAAAKINETLNKKMPDKILESDLRSHDLFRALGEL